MKRHSLLAVLLLSSACETVNVAPQVAQFSEAMTAATEPLSKELEVASKAEREAALQAAISNGQAVYEFPETCLDFVLKPEDFDADACDVILTDEASAKAGAGTATLSEAYLATINSYVDAIAALASDESRVDVAPAATGFLESLGALAQSGGDGTQFAQRLTATSGPLGQLLNSTLDLQRHRALRQVINAAQDPLDEMFARLVAERASVDGLTAGATELALLYEAMEDARGTPQYPRLVAEFGAANESFEERVKGSHAGRLMLARSAHRALVTSVNAPGDLELTVTLFEQIKELKEAVQGATEQ